MDLFIGIVALFFFYYYYLKDFFILIIFLNYYYFFLSFFLPFLLSHVADRVLVRWPGVRPEPLRWKSRVQDIGPPETSRPHMLSISESSPRDLHLDTKTLLHPTASKLQCWTPHANQLARQDKEDVAHIYNGILLSHKKKQN